MEYNYKDLWEVLRSNVELQKEMFLRDLEKDNDELEQRRIGVALGVLDYFLGEMRELELDQEHDFE